MYLFCFPAGGRRKGEQRYRDWYLKKGMKREDLLASQKDGLRKSLSHKETAAKVLTLLVLQRPY